MLLITIFSYLVEGVLEFALAMRLLSRFKILKKEGYALYLHLSFWNEFLDGLLLKEGLDAFFFVFVFFFHAFDFEDVL